MKYDRIADKDNSAVYIHGEGTDYEYVNPEEQFMSEAISRWMTLSSAALKPGSMTFDLHDLIIQKGILHGKELLEEIMDVKLHEGLKQVLNNPKKKEQERLLKGAYLSPFSLTKWEIYASRVYGYTCSRYHFKHSNNGEEKHKFPRIMYLDGEEVKSVGESTMTEGQKKHAIQYKNGVIVNMLDKGSEWHCLFNTFAAITGRERHANGLPHYHYISSKWGLSREKVLKELSKKKYSLPSMPHIELIDYPSR